MAHDVIFKSAMRACGMGVIETSTYLNVPIGLVSTWKRRGAPKWAMLRLRELYLRVSSTADVIPVEGMADGSIHMIEFLSVWARSDDSAHFHDGAPI